MKPSPLIAALEAKKKPVQGPTARNIELSPEELGASAKPGPVSVTVRGYLKPAGEGRMTLEVMMVEPDEDDESPMVRMQDSPSPGAA